MEVAVILCHHLDEPVSGPQTRALRRRVGVHRADELTHAWLLAVQVEAVALLAYAYVTQARTQVHRYHILLQRRLFLEREKEQQWTPEEVFRTTNQENWLFELQQ